MTKIELQESYDFQIKKLENGLKRFEMFLSLYKIRERFVRAIENEKIDIHFNNYELDNPFRFIIDSFYWVDTVEGYDYWNTVNNIWIGFIGCEKNLDSLLDNETTINKATLKYIEFKTYMITNGYWKTFENNVFYNSLDSQNYKTTKELFKMALIANQMSISEAFYHMFSPKYLDEESTTFYSEVLSELSDYEKANK